MFPDDLTQLTVVQLYDLRDALDRHQEEHGRGRSEGAAYARGFCRDERKRIKAELKARGEPTTRPGDKRVYGPGQMAWQKAGG